MNGHVIVVDLGYGDAGKGTVVDWLCATARTGRHPVRAVVRFNGGAQAAHHVLAPSGPPHAFAQFGSGTFTPGTGTFLSRFMLVDPLALVAEAEHLAVLGVPDPLALVAVDRGALLTTPYHRAANQAREEAREEARGDGRHGSCGLGIGETARYALDDPADAPRAGDLDRPRALLGKLTRLRDRLAAETGFAVAGVPPPADLAAVYRTVAGRVTLTGDGYLARLLRQGPVVFEGAQGVLLDEWRGFHPYTTWSTTTFENAETLLSESLTSSSSTTSTTTSSSSSTSTSTSSTSSGRLATRLGVTRTYQTRHGPGPFPTEDPSLGIAEPHNGSGRWQGPFRAGHLDAVALDYARRVTGGVDAVALTHLDTVALPHLNPAAPTRRDPAGRRPGRLRICRGYDLDGAAVTKIEPGPARDLAYQEALSAALLRARPVYSPGEALTAADWPDAVAELLRAPVTVRSYGPAVTDKIAAGEAAGGPTALRPRTPVTIGLPVCPTRCCIPLRRPRPATAVTAT
ncbi:MAG TPA: adenylosuccinate synthetase [Trebonia sp.]